jgi:hypothetical protein
MNCFLRRLAQNILKFFDIPNGTFGMRQYQLVILNSRRMSRPLPGGTDTAKIAAAPGIPATVMIFQANS